MVMVVWTPSNVTGPWVSMCRHHKPAAAMLLMHISCSSLHNAKAWHLHHYNDSTRHPHGQRQTHTPVNKPWWARTGPISAQFWHIIACLQGHITNTILLWSGSQFTELIIAMVWGAIPGWYQCRKSHEYPQYHGHICLIVMPLCVVTVSIHSHGVSSNCVGL